MIYDRFACGTPYARVSLPRLTPWSALHPTALLRTLLVLLVSHVRQEFPQEGRDLAVLLQRHQLAQVLVEEPRALLGDLRLRPRDAPGGLQSQHHG